MSEQAEYMRRAIFLAKQAGGYAAPNPLVGAVIVKNGRIIGEGYHRRCGELHAERNAFASLTESAQGAEMYVTLEPCCHYGRTPPCTEAIIEHQIKKVYIGSGDPNPLVAGKGAKILREHGIEVQEGFLKEECDGLNPVFFHYITKKTPYVVIKYAMTLDGKIAAFTGHSKWITGETARRHVQQLRSFYSAIMVGINTVTEDDPMLNCRIEGAHQPLRIVLDSALRIPLGSRICQSAKEFPTLIVCTKPDEERLRALRQLGAEVYVCQEEEDGKVCLRALMQELYKRQIASVLIEGGGSVHEAALKSGCADHVYAYIAPKILGGKDAKTPVEGQGVADVSQGAKLINRRITELGEDILLEYDIERGFADVHRDR